MCLFFNKIDIKFTNETLGDCSEFSATIPRPFSVRYNPYTQSIETLDSRNQIQKLLRNIGNDMKLFSEAFLKMDNMKAIM